MKKIFKVVAQSAIQQVTRQDGTLTQKCTIVLQEFGGKYEKLLRLRPHRQLCPREVLPWRHRPCRPHIQTQRVPGQVLSGHQRTGHRKFHLALNIIEHV